MTTLVMSSWSLPASRSLADAARAMGWSAAALDEDLSPEAHSKFVFYGGTDIAMAAAERLHLALLEPPLDLLAKLPLEFRRRAVEFARFGDLVRLKAPTFVKPADPLNKSFDAGIYADVRDIRASPGLDAVTPVLVSEPVEWSAEFRCFIKDGVIAAWSPYISFGRPNWKPFGKGTLPATTPSNLTAFCDRLFRRSGVTFPPAFVMDIGVMDDRGWGVVEFNPVWCAGALGADPSKVLAVLDRACQDAPSVSAAERRWVVKRPAQPA